MKFGSVHTLLSAIVARFTLFFRIKVFPLYVEAQAVELSDQQPQRDKQIAKKSRESRTGRDSWFNFNLISASVVMEENLDCKSSWELCSTTCPAKISKLRWISVSLFLIKVNDCRNRQKIDSHVQRIIYFNDFALCVSFPSDRQQSAFCLSPGER